MSLNNRRSINNEIKNLFKHYRNNIIDAYDPERPDFTTNLIKTIISRSYINERNKFNLITNLKLIFDRFQLFPHSINNPENPISPFIYSIL
ncbi:MAG: hypothetical protein GF329_05905 [Candidatus Lokiarchaeota archaeon]|nr:hypothetical protein [Candidatus Lokiarchaeota archaeon]